LTLRPDRLTKMEIPMGTAWLLSECAEARGKQDLWARQKPELLAALREQAKIQSVESSNRIEGVTVPKERLKPLVLGKARPRDRSEEEIAGYRKALDWIFTRKRPVTMEPRVLQHLHALAQGGLSGDSGNWKRRDNEIIEILPNGERRIRFKPTPAKETPKAVETLCRNYKTICDDGILPTPLAVASFVFDLSCIHPFRDGNGRVSRLAATLLLLEHGFQVGRYISLERLVEENKAEYYQILEQCSTSWHTDKNKIVPWWNYFLSIMRRAYQEFEQQMEASGTGPRPAKTELVRQAIMAQVGSFTLAELSAHVPAASPQLVKKVLGQMKRAGQVGLVGRGRGARWEVRSG
jgi:Fic family protein